jgi:hypothetical protein
MSDHGRCVCGYVPKPGEVCEFLPRLGTVKCKLCDGWFLIKDRIPPARDYETLYNELVETTASRIAQGEESHSPHPSHYMVPGLNIELIDIIKAKGKVATNCWEFFCWASCLQYLWRFDLRGCPGPDLEKASVYLGWLKDSIK